VRLDDRNGGPVLGRFHRIDERRARGVEEEVACAAHTAPDDDGGGIQHVDQPGDPLPQTTTDLRDDAPRDGVAVARGIDDHMTGDGVRITAGVRASDERWLPVELAGERMGDALAGVASASDRLGALAGAPRPGPHA